MSFIFYQILYLLLILNNIFKLVYLKIFDNIELTNKRGIENKNVNVQSCDSNETRLNIFWVFSKLDNPIKVLTLNIIEINNVLLCNGSKFLYETASIAFTMFIYINVIPQIVNMILFEFIIPFLYVWDRFESNIDWYGTCGPSL